MKRLTKKDFKERCDFHVYGTGHSRTNVIYYDWKVDESAEWSPEFKGFKYAIACQVRTIRKQELFNRFYDWVTGIQDGSKQPHDLPHWIGYRYAKSDYDRFKIPIALTGFAQGQEYLFIH